ncbi:SPOR domain-containing protein [Caminibacter pacificus]
MKNDDLLNINPKKDMKKPLIYAAIGFLIFIIIVIAVAIFQNMSSGKNNEILPPQPKTEKEIKPQEEFKPLPIETANENTANQNANQNENQNVNENTQNNANTNTNAQTPAATQTNTTQNNTQTQKPKPQITQEPVKNVKPQAKEQKTQKITKKPVKVTKPAVTTKPKKVAYGKYYVQVAALLRNAKPNKKFLALLKKYGFNYKYIHTYIVKNGEKIKVTKILVGPYKTRSDAKRALAKIKREVTQNAFIYKAK